MDNKNQKKGQIASSITWFAATFIILLIVILFFIFSYTFGATKAQHSINIKSSDSESSDFNRGDMFSFIELKGFIKSSIEGRELVREVMRTPTLSDEDKIAIEKKARDYFFDKEYWNVELRKYDDISAVFKSSQEVNGDEINTFLNIDRIRKIRYATEAKNE